MQKGGILIFAALLLFSAAGCSLLKRKSSIAEVAVPSAVDYFVTLDNVYANNFTSVGFEIVKGTLSLSGGSLSGKFNFTARVNTRGDLVGSVKGPLGIELARVLSVGDQIALVDRIKRTVYTGSKRVVLSNYGLPEEWLSLLFGDMDQIKGRSNYFVEGDKMILNCSDGLFNKEITICLGEMKICREKVISDRRDEIVDIAFEEFRVQDGFKYASAIRLYEETRMFHVKLNIETIKFGYNSEIEYSLPSYKRTPL